MKNLYTYGLNEEGYVKKVYSNIIILALIVHLSFVCIFLFLPYPGFAAYNVVSALFYICMLFLAGKEYYRTVVVAIHVEVSLFVITGILFLGWTAGFSMYLIALSTLVYFCPFRRKYLPYLFSICEIMLFFVLKLYTVVNPQSGDKLSVRILLVIYIYNCFISFSLILYAAFLTKISAEVGKKELQDVNKGLAAMANYDQLTNLLSRHCFLEHYKKLKPERAVVVMGDIDDFKEINDAYGHACGDYALRTTAGLLKYLADDGVDICRWGGEEFVIVFYRLDLLNAEERLRWICNKIERFPYEFNGLEFHVTMTFGVCKGKEGEELNHILERADELMYLGKKMGKNRVMAQKI